MENREAYQRGKAANVAPAAVSSQTSFPSQTGPIVLSRTRRSVLLRAKSFMSMPTPRSNPSRKRYPVHRTAMATNQMVGNSSMSGLPV